MKSLLKLPLIALYVLLPSQFLLAQETTDYTTSAGGGGPVPTIIALLIALLIYLVQDRRPAMVVDPPDADSLRKLHHPDYSLHRYGEELRQRRRLRNWPRCTGRYLLADHWFRQCAITSSRRGEAVAHCAPFI